MDSVVPKQPFTAHSPILTLPNGTKILYRKRGKSANHHHSPDIEGKYLF